MKFFAALPRRSGPRARSPGEGLFSTASCCVYYLNPSSINLTKTQRNWIIGIVVVVILIIIGNLSDNDSSSSSSTVYYVNTTTYVATSKSSFDEMFRYINDGDNQALSTLMAYGNVQVLSAGTKVNLISSHFSYCITSVH